jgi:hypothetical protein
MKKTILLGLGLFLLGAEVDAGSGVQTILSFGTMIGNHGPFIGSQNPIRGIPAGGAAWVVLGGAQGQLTSDGQLNIQVSGLVLVSTLMNPVANFRGLVSCLSIGDDGSVTTVNISTGDFPADMDGNSSICDTVALPAPCFAPIIFVTSTAGMWFATTGL